jgi:hypothetical protein
VQKHEKQNNLESAYAIHELLSQNGLILSAEELCGQVRCRFLQHECKWENIENLHIKWLYGECDGKSVEAGTNGRLAPIPNIDSKECFGVGQWLVFSLRPWPRGSDAKMSKVRPVR